MTCRRRAQPRSARTGSKSICPRGTPASRRAALCRSAHGGRQKAAPPAASTQSQLTSDRSPPLRFPLLSARMLLTDRRIGAARAGRQVSRPSLVCSSSAPRASPSGWRHLDVASPVVSRGRRPGYRSSGSIAGTIASAVRAPLTPAIGLPRRQSRLDRPANDSVGDTAEAASGVARSVVGARDF
jgi:hypothetical protein